MKREVFLFYHINYDPSTFFKIKNVALRNKQAVEFRPYVADSAWKEFLNSFINIHKLDLLNNNISLDENYQGFVLLYTDILTGKPVVVLESDKILQTLSI